MSSPASASSPDRRAVLRVGTVIGVAGAAAPFLAACGDGGSTGADATPTQQAQPPATGTIVATADVPVAGSVVKIVQDRKVIVTQPTKGEFHAFSAICTHNGCTVKGVEPEDGLIRCVCHESRFDPTTGAVASHIDPNTGEAVKGPAQAPLATIPITVVNGDVDFA